MPVSFRAPLRSSARFHRTVLICLPGRMSHAIGSRLPPVRSWLSENTPRWARAVGLSGRYDKITLSHVLYGAWPLFSLLHTIKINVIHDVCVLIRGHCFVIL